MLNQRQLNHFNEILDNQSVESTISFGVGSMTTTKLLDEDEIEFLKSLALYQYLNDINEKLIDIAEIIRDTDPDLYQKVKDVFEVSFDDIL